MPEFETIIANSVKYDRLWLTFVFLMVIYTYKP